MKLYEATLEKIAVMTRDAVYGLTRDWPQAAQNFTGNMLFVAGTPSHVYVTWELIRGYGSPGVYRQHHRDAGLSGDYRLSPLRMQAVLARRELAVPRLVIASGGEVSATITGEDGGVVYFKADLLTMYRDDRNWAERNVCNFSPRLDAKTTLQETLFPTPEPEPVVAPGAPEVRDIQLYSATTANTKHKRRRKK